MDINSILKDPNYINANDATKQAIFNKHVGGDPNYVNANDATKQAIQQKWGLGSITTPVEQNQTPTPKQEAPVSQTPAPKQKSNVEAPKFVAPTNVAPTNVAPINPKTITPSTTPAYDKRKLAQDETDVEGNFQKRQQEIENEYRYKMSALRNQGRDVSKPLNVTFKLGEQTFSVKNPQMNILSLQNEKAKKIEANKNNYVKQKGKTVVGQKQKELLDDNAYTQTVLNDELEGLKSDRQYYANLLQGGYENILTGKPEVQYNIKEGATPRIDYPAVKPEILQQFKLKSTGNNNRDYELVKQAITEKISEIDADVSSANINLGISKTDSKNLKNQVDYLKNLNTSNTSDILLSASTYNPKIGELQKKAAKQVGDVTSVDIASADVKKDEQPFFSTETAMKFLANINPIGSSASTILSGLFNMSKEGFFKKVNYRNLGAEKTELTSIDAAVKTSDALLQNRLRKSYDEISSQFNVDSEKVKELALGIMKISDSMQPNQKLAPPKDMDPALFYGLIESPQFTKILNTYMSSSDVFDINGKKERIALAETNKVMQLKAKEFGTLAKMQKDVEREQAFVDVLNKKSKDASILSNDFYNKLAYETAYTLTYGKATVKEMAGGVAKVGETLVEDVTKTPLSNITKSNIDELVYSTDLYDALVPTNSALNLGLFNPNKFIPIKDASGKNLSIEVDGNGKLINIHAEDYAYVVRDPKQKEAIEKYYKENKDELSLTALPLSKTEGGKRAIFDDTFRKVAKEVIQEGPTMAFEIASGGAAGALIKGNKLRKVAQYGIAATSNMIETYPIVYKGYMENTDDPNNPYAAMLTTGALGLVSLWTSSLDRKLIGLGERAVSREVLPEIIENAAPVIRAISKETAKIADKNLRDITFKSAVNKFLSRETLQAFKPAFRRVAAKAGEMGIETGGEVVEETISEPLTQFATNFFNAAIFNNQAYKLQTLDDLNFLDPETAWLTFWTAGAISTAGNISESIQKNNPYTQVDYLKAALKNPDKVEQMLVNIEEDNSPEVMQKIREDYQVLKTSYDDKKKELNISQDLLETLDFNNPAVKIILGQAGIDANVIDNIKGSKNYDALIIQQIVEEKKARDLEANIQEGVSQGLIVQTEDGYKAVGNNPLSKPYEKTISDFEKSKTNLQYFDNFVRDFNTKTAPIQRQFMNELQQSLVVAPDLYDVKNENEDESSIYYNVNDFNNLRNATLAKLVNQERLAEIETEMIGSEDKEKLQEEKANVTESIKEAENTINIIQKQYKAGRTETNEEFQKATETARLDEIALTTALNDVSNKIDVEDVSLDNHEINDIYDKYVKSMEEKEKIVTKLREEYGVDIPKTNIVSREQFERVKEQIVKRRELGKKLRTNQSTLSDLRAFVGPVDTESKMEPETADDIDDILNDESQVLMYADELNLPDTLPYSKVKEEVSVQLHERLRQTAADNAEEALGINEILTTKIDKTTGQNTTYIIDGEEYTVANRPNSNVVTITDEQKTQVVIDELGREIARRLFSDSMALTTETLDAIRNKVLEESYPELDLEIDDATMELIGANIFKLKTELEAQGIEVLFNDKVISSKFTTIPESENSIVGIASKIPLIAITPEGQIHLINFKLFTGNTSDNLSVFDDEMTVLKSLFTDNKVNIDGIHTLPIKVKSSIKDGVVKVEKNTLDFREVANPISPSLIELKTNIALENEILDSIEVKPVIEEETIVEETPVAPVEPVVEPQTPEFEGIEPTSEPVAPVSRTPVYNVGGTSNGVYITVVEETLANKNKIYKIKIDNNPDLNDYYKKQIFETLKDVKKEYAKEDVYVVNGREVVKQPWFAPKDINTNRVYSLQDVEGNSIKSPVQTTLSNVINDFSFVTEGVGSEVSIVELEDVNDSADVQANFVDKARLVVRLGEDNITEIPFGSPIRKKLQTVQVDGKTRLAPTKANISKVIQKDFDRTAPILLEDWFGAFEANNDGPFTYDVGYVQFERDRYVLKNTENKTIYTYPINEEPVLGATYLIVTDANNIRTRFALQTPKLQDVVLNDGSKITKSDVIKLLELVPTETFKEKGKELYQKIINGLEKAVANSDARTQEIANLLAKELGAESTPGRAESTEQQLAGLSNIPAYTAETKDTVFGLIADFLLDRIITLTPESAGKHLITTNPTKVYLDNKLEVNNLVSGDYNEAQEAPRFQVATPQETPQDVVREMVDTLKGTGLANEVFEMTAEEIDAKLQEIGFSEEVRKQVIAYHGSPYLFDSFTTKAIGTGEGAQAFGWGLYFTDLESIAKDYAEKLAKPDTDNFDLDGYFYRKDTEYDPDIMEETVTYFKNEIQITEEEFLKAKEKSPNKKLRNLYKVTLFKGKTPGQYTWLEWDKEVPKTQLEKISENVLDKTLAINTTGIFQFEKNNKFYRGEKTNNQWKFIDRNTGESVEYSEVSNAWQELYNQEVLNKKEFKFYKRLEDFLESDKNASLFLLESGIDGIKYPAESISRGATSETARGFNYVVFDENAVTIEEQVKFQKALQEKGVNLTPTGFTYKGDVYLNMSNMRMDTPIHEFSHLLLDWMKVNKPELYQEGLKKVKAEIGKKDSVIKDIIEFVKTTQPNLTGEALENEILTELSGRKGVDLLTSAQKSGIIDWLKKFWAEVKNMLGLLDASIEQVANMTLEEYANAMAVQLLKGENIISIPKNEMKAFNEGVEAVQKIAEEYKIANKIKNTSHPKLTDLDVNMSEEISKEYDKSEHSPNNPEVKKAYEALERETLSQYDFIVEKGLKVEKWTGEGEPYANSKEMLKDLRDNNHLYFLPNDEAFGKETDLKEGRFGLKKVDKFLKDGYQMTLSEVFRVVHDYFGHGILGNQFGPIGEENATLQHLELYSTDAAPAVVYQTRGQNSWVNFSGANNEVFAMLEEAKKLKKQNKLAESEKIKANALKLFNFAAPKDGILPNIYNFRKYETVRRIREQRNIEQQEAYLDPRGKYEDNDISSNISRLYSSSSGNLGGLNRRNLGTNERVGKYDVNVIAEYTLDKQTEEDIKKAFPAFKGVQKIYEISDGEVYRKLLVDSLEKEKFKASVTLHSAEAFSDMRMFVTEDGNTGITLTKDGFLGGAFSNPQNNRPNNLAQLMLVGIKEGAITAEAFDTVLPNYYAQFGFKAVSRVAFNDELRPTVENGAAADWDYDTYKDFNNGRPDIVFMIYDGGDRNTIQQRLGQFDLYSTYEKPQTESFDKNSYSDAYRFMEISAINKGLVDNIGTFSTETPDIRFQMATEEETTQIPDCV